MLNYLIKTGVSFVSHLKIINTFKMFFDIAV